MPLRLETKGFANLFPGARRQLFEEIRVAGESEDWGGGASFTQPTGVLRKVMLVDSAAKYCTFRSFTVEAHYKPVRTEGCTDLWRLDNAMQDASAFTMRCFLQALRVA